jgi:hypothetical protein
MIHVEPAPEPPDFDERVRKPGRRWLEKGVATDTPGYWRRAARHLRRVFHDRCAYTAMWLSAPGTVDHFVSRDEDRSLSYEWTNLRYAAAWINSKKGKLRSAELLDPFEIGDDWFEIHLPSCLLVMTESCPPEQRARARTMLERLGLADDEDLVEYRREWYRMYLEGELTLDGLERKAPLLARAVRKRGG